MKTIASRQVDPPARMPSATSADSFYEDEYDEDPVQRTVSPPRQGAVRGAFQFMAEVFGAKPKPGHSVPPSTRTSRTSEQTPVQPRPSPALHPEPTADQPTRATPRQPEQRRARSPLDAALQGNSLHSAVKSLLDRDSSIRRIAKSLVEVEVALKTQGAEGLDNLSVKTLRSALTQLCAVADFERSPLLSQVRGLLQDRCSPSAPEPKAVLNDAGHCDILPSQVRREPEALAQQLVAEESSALSNGFEVPEATFVDNETSAPRARPKANSADARRRALAALGDAPASPTLPKAPGLSSAVAADAVSPALLATSGKTTPQAPTSAPQPTTAIGKAREPLTASLSALVPAAQIERAAPPTGMPAPVSAFSTARPAQTAFTPKTVIPPTTAAAAAPSSHEIGKPSASVPTAIHQHFLKSGLGGFDSGVDVIESFEDDELFRPEDEGSEEEMLALPQVLEANLEPFEPRPSFAFELSPDDLVLPPLRPRR